MGRVTQLQNSTFLIHSFFVLSSRIFDHASGITIEIVGSEVSSNGRACGTHTTVCGSVLCDDVVLRLRKAQVLNTSGAEETTIAAYLVSDGMINVGLASSRRPWCACKEI